MSLSTLKMFTRVVMLVGLALGIIGGATIVPRPARANVPPSCSTSPLYTNGTFVTAPGISMATPLHIGRGFLAQPNSTPPNESDPAGDGVLRARLADDFVVTGNGWRPSAVTLYGYQVGGSTTSTINGVVDLRLWNGTPGDGGAIIAGPVAGTITQNAFTSVYRVLSTSPTDTTRPIMAVTINWPFSSVETLAPGTYWLEYGLTGNDILSGPWTPPTVATSGNARQLNLTGGEPGVWTTRTDYTPNTSRTIELPFVICGNPVPVITSIVPPSATAGGGEVTLTVNGSGFVNGAVVRWNGSARPTAFVSDTELTATIPAADIATAGTASITVLNPDPDVASAPFTFSINNPVPTISSLSPASATAGGAAFTLTVNGSGFVSGSVVRWNGSARPTAFVSATQLTAAIPAADIAVAGTASVTVFNPAPGGGESSARTFTINASNPVPTISSLSPASATAGGAAFTLTVNGSNFVSGSVVRWNGSARPTAFVSDTELTATIPAADIATAGTASVTVFNPAPGGGVSSALTFTINNPVPTISSLSPASATAGGTGFTLTVNGSGFVNGAAVRWNGADRPTTFVSDTQLTATIPAADIATAGTASVTVFNPTPGGGESSAATVRIQFRVYLPLARR